MDYAAYNAFRREEINRLAHGEGPCAGCPSCAYGDWGEPDESIEMLILNADMTCNARCVYCTVRNTGKAAFSQREVLTELIARGAVTEKTIVAYVGGEPTVQEEFSDIMQLCLARGCTMRILTNALLYSPYIAETLEKYNSEVNISLDSGTPATYHRIKGVDKFAEVVRNLARYARKGRCEVKYIVRYDNISDEDLFGFLGLCARLPHITVQISLDKERAGHEEEDGALLMFMAKMRFLAGINDISCEYEPITVAPAKRNALKAAEEWVAEHAPRIFPHALAAESKLKIESPFYCPVCGTRVTRYEPLPSEQMAQAAAHGYQPELIQPEFFNRARLVCPHCGAMDRERMTAEYLLRRLGKGFTDPSFLLIEFAPRQVMADFLSREFVLNRKTADLFMDNVDYSLDLTHMPELASNSVDAWVCLHMLEHIPDDDAALRELLRILRPGGFGVMLVPVSLALAHTDEDPDALPEERWRRFGQDDHVRFYAKNDFVVKLKAADFTVLQAGQDWFGEACFTRLGLPASAVLYVLEKPKDL